MSGAGDHMRQTTTAEVRLDVGKAAHLSALVQPTVVSTVCCAFQRSHYLAQDARRRDPASKPAEIWGMSVKDVGQIYFDLFLMVGITAVQSTTSTSIGISKGKYILAGGKGCSD
jgi:hypothetical protein